MSVGCLSRFSTLAPLNRSKPNFVHVIWGMRKTDYKDRKSKIGKLENRKNLKNRKKLKSKFSKSSPNHGANERPKGEPVAVGDLRASWLNDQLSNILKPDDKESIFSDPPVTYLIKSEFKMEASYLDEAV